ncbi:MAG TPA: hypothetical protein VN709_08610 [Terriglobales bacterium]|nr:hypothetical protein [Terriglobales bacterium]
MKFTSLILTILAAAVLFSTACNTYYIPPPPVTITLNNFTPSLVITSVDSQGNLVPATLQLQAAVANSPNQTILYSVGQQGNYVPGGNNVLGFISSTGVYTAPAVLPFPNNVVTVQGIAQADANQVATTNITLLNQSANPTAIAPSTVTVGQNTTFNVVGNFFAPGATVSLSGANLGPVQFISPQQVKIAATITTPGLLSLTINNPDSQNVTNAVAIRSQPASPPTSSAVAVLIGAAGKDSSGNTITATKAYIPEPASLAVVNLEANKQIRSVVMPTGYQPTMVAADPSHNQLVAASAASNLLQLIDGNSDQVTQSLAAPVSTTTTVDGQTCIICGLIVDSPRGLAILDTSIGYMSLDLSTGVASAALVAPAAANFAYDANTQKIYAPFTGGNGGGVNVIDLAARTVVQAQPSAGINFGTAPDTAAFDPGTAVLNVGDRDAGTFLGLNFNNATTNASTVTVPATPYTVTNGCIGTWSNVDLDFTSHLGWFANQGGCVAVAELPRAPASGPPGQAASLRWSQLPIGPDGLPWTNTPIGQTPSLAVFVGADGRAYGLAVRGDGTVLVKMDLKLLQSANAVVGGADANQVDATNVTVNGARVSAMVFIPLR